MLHLPVAVFRGVRGIDGFGGGGYGAPRVHDRNGVDRTEAHLGLDLITLPNDLAVCPFETATFERIGRTYAWNLSLTYVVVRETVGARRLARLLYVAPGADLVPGMALKAGDPLGLAQNLAGAYAEHIADLARKGDAWAQGKLRNGARMTNHIHFGLQDSEGRPIDPTPLLSYPDPTV